ncbi:pentapeptide repeat-containing protein [Streptomyces fimicarius]|uniref:pentapeptide repeat-containing protein n=1 Tax=Streptomyces griseus TaxID=1911 RepID=UPI0035D58E91
MKRASSLRRGDRGLRLWPVGSALVLTFTAATLVAAGVFYSRWELFAVQGLKPQRRIHAKTLFDLVTLSFGVVAGAGALVALVVAYRRRRVDEEGARREATRLHTERFTTAVGQLGDASPAVRLGAVHALAGLADDAPDSGLRQTCIDVLCAYLQLPFTPDPESDDANREEHHLYLSLRKVRHTILRLIGDHYRRPRGTHRSWQGCDLDLTGVTIDDDMNFHDAAFSDGTVNLSGAAFTSGTVTFERAKFSGNPASFGGLPVSDTYRSVGEFRLPGTSRNVADLRLPGVSHRLGDLRLSDTPVSFAGATLTGGALNFEGAGGTAPDGPVDVQ